jgi:hypothetical protein
MHSLFRVFEPYMETGVAFRAALAGGAAPPTAAGQVQRWLRDKALLYVDTLLELLSHREPGIQVGGSAHPPMLVCYMLTWAGARKVPALELLMKVVATESRWLTRTDGQHTVASDRLARVVSALLLSRHWNDQLAGAFVDTYANVHDDVRFYTYRAITYGRASVCPCAAAFG